MINSIRLVLTCSYCAAILLVNDSCNKPNNGGGSGPPPPPPPPPAFDINSINDTYASIAPFTFYNQWSVYNVHDPSIKKFGDTYYCYSTDVGYGITVRSGIQIRKSKDLVEWTFVGWVFDNLPAMGAAY